MKKLLFLLPLLFTSCLNNDDEMSPPESIDPIDQLPPITMEGANTFGCLMNGEVWIPEVTSFSDKDIDAIYNVPLEEFQIHVRLDKDNTDQFMSIAVVNIVSEGSFDIIFFEHLMRDFEKGRSYELDTLNDHKLKITKFDFNNKIITGEFEFNVIDTDNLDTIRIREGRFDVEYRD